MEIIISENSSNYSVIDNYKYLIIKNVKKYELKDFNSYHITSNIDEDKSEDYYLILDFPFSMAFFHWIAECAIYFRLFLKLKQKYSKIKMIFLTERNYHKVIGKFFDIDDNDYIYSLPESNNCIFTLPISPLNNTFINEDYKLYANYFIQSINNNYENINKTIDILILPRQAKDNHHNRISNCLDIINNLKNSMVLNTDDIRNFNDQINSIQSSKIIILTDGSPFLLNGLIAKKSKIIVLGDMVISQIKDYSKMKYYFDIIQENNEIIFIPYLNGNFYDNNFLYNDIKEYL